MDSALRAFILQTVCQLQHILWASQRWQTHLIATCHQQTPQYNRLQERATTQASCLEHAHSSAQEEDTQAFQSDKTKTERNGWCRGMSLRSYLGCQQRDISKPLLLGRGCSVLMNTWEKFGKSVKCGTKPEKYSPRVHLIACSSLLHILQLIFHA